MNMKKIAVTVGALSMLANTAQAATLLNQNFDAAPASTMESWLLTNPASVPTGTVWSSTTNANAVNLRSGTDAINTYNAGNPLQRFSFASGTTFFNASATNKFLVLGDDSAQLAGGPYAGTFAFAMPFEVAAGTTRISFSYDWVFKAFTKDGTYNTDQLVVGIAGNGFNIANPFSLNQVLTNQSIYANGALQGPTNIEVAAASLGAADVNGKYYLVFALEEQVGTTNLSTNSAVGIDNILITAVPEPDTYAMLLAGLGILAAVALRRKTA